MNEGLRLSEGLWSIFRDEVATGEPVFFCFSQETLKEQLAASGLESGDPIVTVCSAAKTCYDTEGHFVSLRPESLVPGAAGLSMAIVLVCQQVLAVEEMVRDGGRHSENAYFPRLRSLMSPDLPLWSINPYRFDEFESIWRRFAREIRGIQGSSDDSITFEFGAYSGVNKARLFPLSQALLSRADLSELTRRCRVDRLRKESSRDAWVEIRRERNHLSRRGQKLVNSGFLQDRILEQVQRYARRVVAFPSNAHEAPHPREHLEIAIGLDVTDWFNEEYTAFLTVKGTFQRFQGSRRVGSKLEALLAAHGYAFFVLSDTEDYWVFKEGSVEVDPSDSILLVGITSGIQRGMAVLDGLEPPISVDASRVRLLHGTLRVHVCPVTLPVSLKSLISIRGGRLLKDESRTERARSYAWEGGVCVDRRSRKFLRAALPSCVRFESQEYRMSELVRVGDSAMSFDGFQQALDNLTSDASFDILFPNGRAARLAVGVEDGLSTRSMGFYLNESGVMSPTLERIGSADAAVVGFTQPQNALRTSISSRGLANLIRDLRKGEGSVLTTHECQFVQRAIDESSLPEHTKSLIRHLLHRTGTVTENTRNELCLVPQRRVGD